MNTMILHLLVSRVREHNMGIVRGVEIMERIRRVKRIEKVRGAIKKIR